MAHRWLRKIAQRGGPLLLSGALLVSGGCASKPWVLEDRSATTGIAPGDKVSVVLTSYARGGSQQLDLERAEKAFTSCLNSGMAHGKPFTLIAGGKLGVALRSVNPIVGSAHLAEAIPDLLAKDELSRQLALDGVRYLVLLNASLTTDDGHWDGFGGKGGFLVVAKTWTKYSILEANVVDVTNLRLSGRLVTASQGQESVGMGLALIVPFPIGWWSMSESRACWELGAAIARFLSSEAGP